jgi:hypothetical protein
MSKKNQEGPHREKEGKRGVSRRKWMINVGKAAALAGMSSKAGAFGGKSAMLQAAESQTENFPPGLYRPSFDHLSHALESDARFHVIPPDCPVDYIRPHNGPFQPQFFSIDEYKVIHRLTALVLGEEPDAMERSASHGHTVADEVAEWIDLRTHSFAGVRAAAERLTPEQITLAEAYDGARLLRSIKVHDPQEIYHNGLAWIENESERRHQRRFLELDEKQQTAILDAISDERAGREAENAGTRFFHQLKSDIISGFYTSQTGLKELDYLGNRFYAESPGCKNSGKTQHESSR